MPERRRTAALVSALRLLSVAAVVGGAAGPASAAERIPLEHLFASPEVTRLRLSPDGHWLAGIVPKDDHQALVVIDAATLGVAHLHGFREPRLSPLWWGSGEHRIGDFWWANDERLVVSLTLRGGHMSYLRLIGRDGSRIEDVRHRPQKPLLYHQPDEILNLLPDDPRHVLMAFPRTRAGEFVGHGVVRVDVLQGDVAVAERPYPRILRWFTDPTGAVRAGFGVRGSEGFLRWRDDGGGRFDELTQLGGVPFDPFELRVLGVGPGPLLYVASRHAGEHFAVYVYDMDEGRFSPASYSQPGFDVAGPLVTDAKGVPIGVHYVADYARIHWFEPEWQERQRRIDAALGGGAHTIESWDRARRHFVVRSEDDRRPPVYWLWTEPDGGPDGELRRLDTQYPDLGPKQLADSVPVRIPAPDGLVLPAYLTRPPGSEGRRIPFLIEPRGQGWPRARRGFDAELQFLVNRGWGVLRLNARGSFGYGRRLEVAGLGEWGRAAQEDVAAAARWLAERGEADPGRICVYGHGYGGYAALMALERNADLFACGVSISGISDLDDFGAHRSRLSDDYLWMRRLDGDGKRKRLSPIESVARIKAPVFLAHGQQDLEVPAGQSAALASRLESAGKEYTFVELDDDGHQVLREEGRLRLYGALEKFLDAVLAAPVEKPAPSDP